MAELTLAKSLMIIGAGAEQVPAYERAKARGLIVIGTDIDPSAPGLAYADHVVVASTRNPEQTAGAALEFSRSHPINGVMTIANDVPLTVATVAKSLDLPSISIDSARIAQNKLRMKDAFQANSVACPRYWALTSVEQLRGILHQQPEKKFVIKPVDGRGARGVLLIDYKTDLGWAFAESVRWGESGQLILEEFIPGIQLSTESFIQDGKVYTAAYALRNYSRIDQFKPFIIEDGGDIPAPLQESLKPEIDQLIFKGALAMGIQSGIVKGDIVVNEQGKPMIIELAARLSGGWFASHQIPAATGIDLVDVAISHALGEPIVAKRLQASKCRATSIRYWFPPPGRISSVIGDDALKDMPNLLKFGFFRSAGDIQPVVRMHPDRFGFVIAEGSTPAEAQARVQAALNTVQIEVS